MRRLSSFSFLIGLVLFVLLLRMVDLGETWELLKSADPRWAAAAFLFLVPEVLFKGLRILALSRVFPSKLTYSKAVWIYLAGQPVSAVTPAKLGDVVRVLGISRWGALRPHSAFAVHAADKVYDLLALGTLALIGLITLILRDQNQAPAVAALLGIGVGIVLMALFLHPRWMETLVKPLLLFLAPKRLAGQLRAHGREFYNDLLKLFQPARRVPLPLAFSLGAWGTVLVRASFCALALGLPLPFSTIALLLPVVIVIEFIPISILGFGTREAALFLFFASTGVSNAGLLSFSLMMVLAGPLFTSVVGVPFALKLSQSSPEKS